MKENNLSVDKYSLLNMELSIADVDKKSEFYMEV